MTVDGMANKTAMKRLQQLGNIEATMDVNFD